MRRILPVVLSFFVLCILSLQAAAQSGTYGNEWIDYSKTYYKFKVTKAGIYRISRASLDAAGLPPTVNGDNFILFRDGLEVPIYVSAVTMAGADYIEFAGRGADGVLDKELYENPAWQPDTRISMFTDTACYFLTYDNNANHLRFDPAANTIPATPPAAETYNWTTVGNYYKNVITEGQSYDTTYNGVGLQFYSPSFDNGEGFVQSLQSGASTSLTLGTPNFVAAPVNASLRTSLTSKSFHLQHQATVSVNGNQVASGSWGTAETRHFTPSFPASQLSASNTISYGMTVTGTASGTYDAYGVSYIELEYPRNYDVAGLTMHAFRLAASSSAQYLEFSNFSSPARLYDLTNRKYYTGDVLNGKTRFYLPASLTDRQLVLTASNTPTAVLSPAKTIRFTDFTGSSNQGDYVIITHSRLMDPIPGSSNIIQDYKNYRASSNGGAHKVQIADVTELYDQFGYGYDAHPQSIRHFLQYAYDRWTTKPVAVNIIGHGLQYDQYKTYYANPSVYTFPFVPVYGNPGSDVDFVNFGTPRTQKLQIGRVSVWDGNEVSKYLAKIIAYEDAIRTGSDAASLWKKRVMHLAGAESISERDARLATLNGAAAIIRDTLMGATVNTFSKGSTNPVEQITAQAVDSLINSGQSLVTYFGHASPNTLGFNLPEPEAYHANPKFPVFIALGCDVAQMFTVSANPPAPSKTLSEKYTLASTGGSVALLATDNYGYTGFLDNYLYEYYASTSQKNYGGTVGLHTITANNQMYETYKTLTDFKFYFTQIESQILTGDPGLVTYGPSKPDYHVAAGGISVVSGTVSTAVDSFQLRITSYNLARSLRDTVEVKVEHINPAGTRSLVRTYPVVNLFHTDTTLVWVPVNKVADIGLNRYHVTIDPQNKIDEMNELNNEAELTQFIYSDNLVPVYPAEFAIVHKQGVTLKASTLNPFRPAARYVLELDTTTDFNSPLKLQTSVNSLGGLIKWTPSLLMKDSTVYYWRAALDSQVNGSLQWSGSSFVYLAAGSDGWNQSHYFQYKRDSYTDMDLKQDRLFKYDFQANALVVYNKVILQNTDGNYVRVVWNGNNIQRGPQIFTSLQVMVIDSVTAKFWKNTVGNTQGALPPADATKGAYLREFDMTSAVYRDSARRFIESVPNGDYIMVKNVFWDFRNIGGVVTAPIYIDQWKADTVAYGSGHSLYHAIRNLGFPTIDSFQREGAFLFMKRKGEPANISEQWTRDSTVTLIANINVNGYGTSGSTNSTVIGPASQWTNLKWKNHANDGFIRNDRAYVSVYGITAANVDTFLFNSRGIDSVTTVIDTTLAQVSAAKYPKLRLVWRTTDTATATPPQLDYWRVMYTPVPEAALNLSANFAFTDSLQVGQLEYFSVAVENLTDIDFRDSMLVTYKVINASGVSSLLKSVRYKKLLASDTLHAALSFDPAAYPGRNSLFVEVNPNNDQPEQYHPNNLGYLPFTIGVDKNNPLLDVTFDGVHILNRDIVSAKPFIKISLKDDNQFLALDDTSLVKISLKGQSHATIDLPFNGTTSKFIPGQTGADHKNTAVIELRPELEDDVYTLQVEGRDRSNNRAGATQGSTTAAKYTVEFEVINKATVTNVLNYPNPFSTATSFLFTITGSQLPSQFKIQVLSVTGKVVREITKEELGPLHIGRNITEYKWDGRDQYGQLLGNGVYMYRVATSLNGEQIEHRNGGGDRFFKNGYGKMYIMR